MLSRVQTAEHIWTKPKRLRSVRRVIINYSSWHEWTKRDQVRKRVMHRRPGISPSRVVLDCSGCRGPSQRNRWHSLSDQFSQHTAGPFRKRGARWGWNVPRVVTMAHFCTRFNFWVFHLLPFATKQIEWFGEIQWQLPSISSLTQIVSSWAKKKKNSPGMPCQTNYRVLICLFPPTHHTWRVGNRMFKMSSSVPMIQQGRQAWR